ncbi:MAG: DegT/DnrJ/EryC1/StrS family aminotransferase, partial [Armatimonadota bacterium]|nr:DegT/DnrJ/EryC1/StrS family aminotransferase [Armatimonadota bacterium]
MTLRSGRGWYIRVDAFANVTVQANWFGYIHSLSLSFVLSTQQEPLMTHPLAIHGGKPTIPSGTFLPSPPTTALDEAMVLESLRSGSHAWGTNCEALQKEWAAWNGNDHCIAVNSGTASLQMCLAACGVGAGDEVITPAFSWTSSTSCILHQNAIPVFVDVDSALANLDPQKIEQAITQRTRAILVVHLHGVPADMDPILEIGRRHGIPVIEDACQAHGARYKGQKVGTLGACAGFSLNQNKMLSAGEGGLFVADDKAVVERARSLVLFGDFREWGTVGTVTSQNQASAMPPDVSKIPGGYPAYGMGYMYRYNELCAAYARAQLQQLDASIEHARA